MGNISSKIDSGPMLSRGVSRVVRGIVVGRHQRYWGHKDAVQGNTLKEKF